WPLTRLASSRSISPSLVTRSTMLGDTNGDFKRKLLGKTEEKVRGYRSVALNHYCGNGYAFCVMISRKLGLGSGSPSILAATLLAVFQQRASYLYRSLSSRNKCLGFPVAIHSWLENRKPALTPRSLPVIVASSRVAC